MNHFTSLQQSSRPSRTFQRFIHLGLLFGLLLGMFSALLGRLPVANAEILAGSPYTLVPKDVNDFALADNKVFWHAALQTCPYNLPDHGGSIAEAVPERIVRTAVVGSEPLELLNRLDTTNPNSCNPYHITSNIVADKDFVYFVDNNGLQKLSLTQANAITLVNATVKSGNSYNVELALDNTSIYAIVPSTGSVTASIRRILKATGASQTVSTEFSAQGRPATNLQSNGDFLFWLFEGKLRRLRLSDNTEKTIATGVTAYFADGPHLAPSGFKYSSVYIGQGSRMVVFSNNGEDTMHVLDSFSPQAQIYEIRSFTEGTVFWLERQLSPGTGFQPYIQTLYRNKFGQTTQLYAYRSSVTGTTDVDHLVDDSSFVVWREADRVMRLPVDAAAVPNINMRITGLELTQGIQDLNQSVPLIKSRRTYARLYVKSDGDKVLHVTARLHATWDGGGDQVALIPSTPANPSNASPSSPYNIVRPDPLRSKISDSFLFELPAAWTTHVNLRLNAVLNPYQTANEPNYLDNTADFGPFNFQTSPLLDLKIVVWKYTKDGKQFGADFFNDVLPIIDYLKQTYPIATDSAAIPQNPHGLRYKVDYKTDDALSKRLDPTSPECTIDAQGNPISDPDRRCALDYVNAHLSQQKQDANDTVSYLGLITPYDQALVGIGGTTTFIGSRVSSVMMTPKKLHPSPTVMSAHELAHGLGRGHPVQNSGTKQPGGACGHTAEDYNYPYEGARINPEALTDRRESSFMGFQAPYKAGFKPLIVPVDSTDFMSYCVNQWISDHTYKCLLNALNNAAQPAACSLGTPPTSFAAPQPSGDQAAGQMSPMATRGDALNLSGFITADRRGAKLTFISRRDSTISALAATGSFGIQLYDSQRQLLVSYPFTPVAGAEESSESHFSLAVPFVAGTREFRIVDLSNGQTLLAKSISATRPTVANLAIGAQASGPLTGTAALSWNAMDADRDPMLFDLYASSDGGTTFEPLHLNMSRTTTDVNLNELSGGSLIFRVVASDGIQTGQTDSAPVTIANKPPVPHILNPREGTHIYYGQLINFTGMADNLQSDIASLTWSNQYGTLGTGPLLSVNNLPLGTNLVTLTAKNQAGQEAKTSITVVVVDDFTPLGPTLNADRAEVVWHVGNGTIEPQQTTLHLDNAGSGALSWVASSNAAWLKLSASNGAVPAAVTLTADPAGMTANNTLTATLTLSGKVNGKVVQTITLPAQLAMGNVWDRGGTRSTGPVVRTSRSQITMRFPAGATDPQSVDLAIENIGDGTFSWSATCPWKPMTMRVNDGPPVQGTVSGNGPAQIIATIDPAGLAAGSSRTVEMRVDITIPGQGAQTIMIPVDVEVEAAPPVSGAFTVFLPLVQR